jgi:hypothetical protein
VDGPLTKHQLIIAGQANKALSGSGTPELVGEVLSRWLGVEIG